MSPFDRLDRALPGDRLRPRDAAGVHVRPARTVEPRPNAPLLLRIVRHPYGLFPGRPARRVVYRAKVEPPESVDRRRVLAEALAERRAALSTGRVPVRTRPFAVRPSRWPHLPEHDA